MYKNELDASKYIAEIEINGEWKPALLVLAYNASDVKIQVEVYLSVKHREDKWLITSIKPMPQHYESRFSTESI